jgi:quinol monooxygenase YgiN
MPIQTIARYRVKPSGVDKVKQAIAEFVPHVRANEPGTKLYPAWQEKDDPTRFVHFFIFEDEAAHAAHGSSAAVKRFEAAYGPELSEGDVVFTDCGDQPDMKPSGPIGSVRHHPRSASGNAQFFLRPLQHGRMMQRKVLALSRQP